MRLWMMVQMVWQYECNYQEGTVVGTELWKMVSIALCREMGNGNGPFPKLRPDHDTNRSDVTHVRA